MFVSEDVKKAFLDVINDSGDNRVIYNVIQSDMIRQLAEQPVNEEVFANSAFKICTAGKIVPVKGIDRLAGIHRCSAPFDGNIGNSDVFGIVQSAWPVWGVLHKRICVDGDAYGNAGVLHSDEPPSLLYGA